MFSRFGSVALAAALSLVAVGREAEASPPPARTVWQVFSAETGEALAGASVSLYNASTWAYITTLTSDEWGEASWGAWYRQPDVWFYVERSGYLPGEGYLFGALFGGRRSIPITLLPEAYSGYSLLNLQVIHRSDQLYSGHGQDHLFQVSIDGPGGRVDTTTDEWGRLLFVGPLEPGSYTVDVWSDGFYAVQFEVELAAEGTTHVRVQMEADESLSFGHVWVQFGGTWVVGPFPTATIELIDLATGEVIASVFSDPDGRAGLGPVEPGTYRLRVSADGYRVAEGDRALGPGITESSILLPRQ